MVMGLLGAAIFSIIISLLKTSKLLYVLSISVTNFFIVLFITRMFDKQTKQLVELILDKLDVAESQELPLEKFPTPTIEYFRQLADRANFRVADEWVKGEIFCLAMRKVLAS